MTPPDNSAHAWPLSVETFMLITDTRATAVLVDELEELVLEDTSCNQKQNLGVFQTHLGEPLPLHTRKIVLLYDGISNRDMIQDVWEMLRLRSFEFGSTPEPAPRPDDNLPVDDGSNKHFRSIEL